MLALMIVHIVQVIYFGDSMVKTAFEPRSGSPVSRLAESDQLTSNRTFHYE